MKYISQKQNDIFCEFINWVENVHLLREFMAKIKPTF